LSSRVAIAGRAAAVVDDGAATGMTMVAALRHLRDQQPAQRVAALPVASRDALAVLRAEATAVVYLSSPRRFRAAGAFYRSFAQVSDAEVAAALKDQQRAAP
jgi:putative phosphoribosyl transferase